MTTHTNEATDVIGAYLAAHGWFKTIKNGHYMRVIWASPVNARFCDIYLHPKHIIIDGHIKIQYEDPQLMEYIEDLTAKAGKSESDVVNG